MTTEYYYNIHEDLAGLKNIEPQQGETVSYHKLKEISDGIKEMVIGTQTTVRFSTQDAALTLTTDEANLSCVWPVKYLNSHDQDVFKQIFEAFNKFARVYTDKKDRPDSVVESEYLYLRLVFDADGVSYVFSITPGENYEEGFVAWDYIEKNKEQLADLVYILSVFDGSYEHIARVIRARGGAPTKISMEIV